MSTISASTTSTTAYKVTADTTGTLVLQTGATPTTAVTIDGSQRVGIGTSSPTGTLHVANTSASVGQLRLQYTGYNFFEFQAYSDNKMYINNSSGVSQMVFDGSGNVGIGTSSPATQVHVNGNSDSYFTAGYRVNRYTTTGQYGTTNYANGTFNIVATDTALSSPAITFRTSTDGSTATERARIDSSGNLLIGATSFSGVGNNVLISPAGVIYCDHANGTASGTAYQNFFYNNTSIGSVTQNGTTGVLYNLTSDYRLKNNPTPVTGAKEFVMALQPKTWDWWDGSGKGVGFIAHEFMEVAKYSGNGEKDAVDENGNPVYQSIQPSSSEVMANLVALLQEQQAIIEALTNRITALEAK